ncbi:MAG: bifunctional 2-polyprenyl-6-hydroxyphenol methylase/3-demethylubiquinol 3-O-methyltransferase UbiG, partial [Desulfobacteraceae bacterium]|nr:bifunctional 2-polyprenyl-6-hydroxyphenol methylase/3-demethylubiquinol 3-O-methyltransferase UbiG [Desulfobacteraceae bacterium]
MKINNEFYESHGHTWWADDAPLDYSSLRYCMNPVRYGYFKRKLAEIQPPGNTVLDVGCGGGFLSEEFARDGYRVTGIDPAGASIEAARRHASAHRLDIDYRGGRGEALPFPDASFDIVVCCDVLEHVDAPGPVIREISRVLKDGGIFFYDTLNRTWFSKIAAIKVWQDWARLCQPGTHVWEMFIKPAELVALLNR